MTNGSELKSRGAKALREAGYVPLPRWWVTLEQMELIEYMAKQNQEEVNRIRGEARNTLSVEDQIDLAWLRHRGEQ